MSVSVGVNVAVGVSVADGVSVGVGVLVLVDVGVPVKVGVKVGKRVGITRTGVSVIWGDLVDVGEGGLGVLVGSACRLTETKMNPSP